MVLGRVKAFLGRHLQTTANAANFLTLGYVVIDKSKSEKLAEECNKMLMRKVDALMALAEQRNQYLWEIRDATEVADEEKMAKEKK